MEERNCNNCGNYKPSDDYQNTEKSDRSLMIPVFFILLLCVIGWLWYQNNELKSELQTMQKRHNNCISVDSDGNMWFTKGDTSELVTPSNIWDELDKLGNNNDTYDYSDDVEGSNPNKAKSIIKSLQ